MIPNRDACRRPGHARPAAMVAACLIAGAIYLSRCTPPTASERSRARDLSIVEAAARSGPGQLLEPPDPVVIHARLTVQEGHLLDLQRRLEALERGRGGSGDTLR